MPRSGRSQSLTREEIVAATLRLLRREGLGGLTMRAVAGELGVTAMAVYHYFSGKEELLAAAYAEISASWDLLRLGEDGWEESLRRHLLALWRDLFEYPGLGAYLIERPNINVTETSMAAGVRFFEDAGFPPREARLAWSFALTYIHGRISVDAHLGHKPDAPRLEGLRAHDYVEFGVDTVVLGLRAILAHDASAPGSRRDGVGTEWRRALRA